MFIELNIVFSVGRFEKRHDEIEKRLININSIDFIGDNFIQIGTKQLKTVETYEEIKEKINNKLLTS